MNISAAGATLNVNTMEAVTLALGIAILLLLLMGLFGGKLKFGKFEVDMKPRPADTAGRTACPFTELRNAMLRDIERLNDKLESLCANMNEVMTERMMQILYDDSLPLLERMIAGLKYIRTGNNAEVKKDALEIVKTNPDLYAGIVELRPDLMIEESPARGA